MDIVAADAAVARHLSAARDADLADLGAKVNAHRAAINALGVQTASRFDRVDSRFDQIDSRFGEVDSRFGEVDDRFDRLENEMRIGFAEMRAKFDQSAAGHEQIVGILTTLISQQGEEP